MNRAEGSEEGLNREKAESSAFVLSWWKTFRIFRKMESLIPSSNSLMLKYPINRSDFRAFAADNYNSRWLFIVLLQSFSPVQLPLPSLQEEDLEISKSFEEADFSPLAGRGVNENFRSAQMKFDFHSPGIAIIFLRKRLIYCPLRKVLPRPRKSVAGIGFITGHRSSARRSDQLIGFSNGSVMAEIEKNSIFFF